jgi:hypothetical protein
VLEVNKVTEQTLCSVCGTIATINIEYMAETGFGELSPCLCNDCKNTLIETLKSQKDKLN